jgi:hypothetical protein
MNTDFVKKEVQMQQWSQMIAERQNSGMSIDTWCQIHDISKRTYYYRLKKVREFACDSLSTYQNQSPEFTPLPLEVQGSNKNNTENPSSNLTVTIKGLKLTVGAQYPCDNLVRILEVLLHAE